MPSANDVTQCLFLLKNFRKWFESRVLGCSLDRWQEVTSKADLYAWLDEAASHAASDLGFYLRFAASADLAKLGKGHGNFISGGGLELSDNYVAWAGWDRTLLTIGINDPPFSLESISSSAGLTFMERSLPVALLVL